MTAEHQAYKLKAAIKHRRGGPLVNSPKTVTRSLTLSTLYARSKTCRGPAVSVTSYLNRAEVWIVYTKQLLFVFGVGCVLSSSIQAQHSPVTGVLLQLSDDDNGSAPGMQLPLGPSVNGFDANLISQGEQLFQTTCVECHEAERATEERKTFGDWMSTIAEMSEKEDADIPPDRFVPIAVFLASLGPPDPSEESHSDEMTSSESGRAGASSSRPTFDPQVVSRGQSAFQSSCTKCHDANRALSKRKPLAGWIATVRRMAGLDDADVATADIRPIATYLTSLGGGDASAQQEGDTEYDSAISEALSLGSDLNVSGTLSTQWRGGNDNLENPNFFADAWIRFDWQPEGPIRGRVTTCTSCHSDQTSGGGFTLELVEAAAYLDLLYGIRKKDSRPEYCKSNVEAELRAGRFVVPFGAFHSMSHPGVYRTVTNPLMYNMGRQVQPNGSRPPVIPMPYSDEGVDLHAVIPLRKEWKITLDGYAVNGLQGGGPGVNFTRSRSYADNNHDAGYGGRATISNRAFQWGGSVMAGRLEDEGASPLNYHLAGTDATARLCGDDVRLYFEYALRRNDSIFGQRQISYGIVSELEVLLFEKPNLSALARYDTLEHRDFFGETSIERFTWGVSTTIGGTLLIFNHEHWNFPTDETEDVDVVGVRWVATF